MTVPRRWLDRCAVVGLATCVVACFTDAPPLEGDTGSTSRADSSAAEADATGSPTTSMDDDGPTTVDATGTTTTTATSADDAHHADAESATGEDDCQCPADAVLCDDFEDDLTLWLPPAGNPGPTIGLENFRCGESALRAEMPAEEAMSTVSALLQDDGPLVGSWSLGGWYYISGECLQATDVRILRLWLDDDEDAPPEYLVDVLVDDEALRLRATGPDGEQASGELASALVDVWVEFRVSFDVSEPASPEIVAMIDKQLVSVTEPPAASLLTTLRTYPTLGVVREGPAMNDANCIVDYDDVWFGPTP